MTTWVCHGGSVSRTVCDLLHQVLIHLSWTSMRYFMPRKIGKGTWGFSESTGDGRGSATAGIGLSCATKTAMIIGGKGGLVCRNL